jgi:molybdate transport system ATP-binding protein
VSALFDAHVVATRGGFGVDVALRAGAGETLVVVGPNGAGKSTVLHALAGLVPLAGGYVRVDGRPVGASAPARRPFGVVFQDGLLFPHMSVLDNVAFGLRARGMRRSDANAHAAALLGRFGLAAVATAHPRALSGGQAQRVALARALAVAPRVLLLDEPLAALDAGARVEVRRALREHLADYEGARVLVTHDPLEALTLGDRLVVLDAGRVVQEGTPDEVRRHPRSAYVAQLLGINVLEGTLHAGREVRLRGGALLHVALDPAWSGPCVAVVEPSAITLSATPPHASARNTWEATVVDVDREPNRVRVRVDAPALVVDVTPGAAAELGLAPGTRVWCALKATAVSVRQA